MFRLNFKIAVRNLWKYKVFTLINAGGLAIGLVCCMILLLYVAYEWGYDKQFTNYKNTYIVYHNSKSSTGMTSTDWTPGVLAENIKEKMPGVAYVSHSTYPQNHVIGYRQNSFRTAAVYADPDFLKILSFCSRFNSNTAIAESCHL